MTATNHALTGAAIGLVVGQPLLAIPLAFVSHFICDAIPHFRSSLPERQMFQSWWFKKYLVIEAIFVFTILGYFAATQPINWQLAIVCAGVAVLPDVFLFNRFYKVSNNKKWKPSLFIRFSSGIQWFERPIGGLVEAAWFVAALLIIMPFVR